MPTPRSLTYIGLMALIPLLDAADADAVPPTGYRRPPQPVLDVLDAPPPPAVSVSPARDNLLLVHLTRYPSIADLAAPMERLAGLRINPRTFGPHLPPNVVGLTLQPLTDGLPEPFGLPVHGPITAPVWSPDGRRFAYTHPDEGGYQLWVGDVAARRVRRIDG